MENNLAKAYLERESRFKEVTLPVSGLTFKIRKVSSREQIKKCQNSLLSLKDFDKKAKEKNEVLLEKMSPEERQALLEYNAKTIQLAVVEPLIVLEESEQNPAEGKLWISSLEDADFEALTKAVTEFSLGRQDSKSFRTESESAADPGRDGKTV